MPSPKSKTKSSGTRKAAGKTAKKPAKPKKPRLRFCLAKDNSGYELWFNGVMIRKFPHKAKAQILILLAFQECGWPKFIHDPLPRDVNRLQSPEKRLRSTVAELNNSLLASGSYFLVNGDGESVRFDAAPHSPIEGRTIAEPRASPRSSGLKLTSRG